MAQKFKPGDRVRIVGYGAPFWSEGKTYDMLPQIVGKEGVVIGSYADQRDAGVYGFAGGSRPSGEDTYSVSGIPGKQSWYDEQQLELIT